MPRLQVSEAADAGNALVLEKLEMGLACKDTPYLS